MTDVNLRGWTDPEIAGSFREADWISAAERAVFEQAARRWRGGKIVDIGVGAGRTTPALLAISRDYLGLDYSCAMIALCRAKFPGVAFECADARDLGAPAESFDLAVIAFNGLDYASHEGRQRILRGVFRLLKPGGGFVFSTHNRSMKGYDSFPLPVPPIRRKPWVVLSGWARFAAGLVRHVGNLRGEVRTPDYAIINEPQFNYALMTYYVTIEEQLRQLRAAGFQGPVEIYDHSGEKVSSDSKSRDLYYIAAK